MKPRQQMYLHSRRHGAWYVRYGEHESGLMAQSEAQGLATAFNAELCYDQDAAVRLAKDQKAERAKARTSMMICASIVLVIGALLFWP